MVLLEFLPLELSVWKAEKFGGSLARLRMSEFTQLKIGPQIIFNLHAV